MSVVTFCDGLTLWSFSCCCSLIFVACCVLCMPLWVSAKTFLCYLVATFVNLDKTISVLNPFHRVFSSICAKVTCVPNLGSACFRCECETFLWIFPANCSAPNIGKEGDPDKAPTMSWCCDESLAPVHAPLTIVVVATTLMLLAWPFFDQSMCLLNRNFHPRWNLSAHLPI